jgi:hypothetical protein
MGSTAPWAAAVDECPTCHHPVEDSLLPQGQNPMTLEHNIEFLEEQQRVFRLMEDNATSAINSTEQQYRNFTQELSQLRSEIRSLKRTLVSDPRLPSHAELEARIALRSQLDRMIGAERVISDQMNALPQIAEEWRHTQEEKRNLPTGTLSKEDVAKLNELEQRLQTQLDHYGFSSVPTKSVKISQSTYRPEHAGFDLQFDLSASDAIRATWAYRLALLEVGRMYDTNHPGLLIIDEPRQQETSTDSLRRFFERAAESAAEGGQIIVALSRNPEDPVEIQEILKGVPHTELYYPSRIIAPLSANSGN